MPLNTQLERADPTATFGLSPDASGKGVGWSWWHLNRLADAIIDENPEEYNDEDHLIDPNLQDMCGPFPSGYIFREDHEFTDLETNIWDRGGEVGVYYTLKICAGDKYRCWR